METTDSKGGMRTVVLALAVLLLSACCEKTTVPPERDYAKEDYQLAKVINPGIAGCDYILMIASINYQPLNLSPDFKKEGTEVWVKYHKEKNQMTNCMMGDIITIDDIHLRGIKN